MGRDVLRAGGVACLLSIIASALYAEDDIRLGNSSDWPQWGGPGRNFQAPQSSLVDLWPETGPTALWRRPLGDGNSAITVVGRTLYTMYRNGEREVVIALDRTTGATLWETGWVARTWEGFLPEFGQGPHATPLVVDGRLYAVGLRGKLVCLDASTGGQLWDRDLWVGANLHLKEFGPPQLGYTASPLLLDGRLVVLGGDKADGVLAIDPLTGAVLWTSAGLEPTFASPIAIRLDGETQLVVFMVEGAAGLDPGDGTLLWRASHETPYWVNASTPIWNGRDTLFVSSAYDAGSRGLRLTKSGAETAVAELWKSRAVQIHHQTAVLIDDIIYASSGDFGPAFLAGIHQQTGKVVFKQRGFAKASLLASGRRIVILDEDGVLALATARPDGISIDARAQVFSTRSWTVPTLVGTTLFARDRQEIAAFDLGTSPGS